MRRYFPAWIHKDGRSVYGISFRDFPGCIAAGSTVDDAILDAMDALALHVEGMAEDGTEVPEPTSADIVLSEADRESFIGIVMISMDIPDSSLCFEIALPEDLVAEIERIGADPSTFLIEAARKSLREQR